MSERQALIPVLSALLAQRALSDPTTVALVTEGQPVTYGELQHSVELVQRHLQSLGITHGDRVAIWLPNGAEWLACLLACMRIGAIAVAVNTRFRSHELADLLLRSAARVLIHQPGFNGIDFIGILSRVEAPAKARLEHVIDVASALAAAASAEPPADSVTDSAPCLIFTTSGTTRAPKFVLHDQQSLARHSLEVAQAFGLFGLPRASLLGVVPMCGTFGLVQALACLTAGALFVTHALSDPARELQAIGEQRISHLLASDMTWSRLLDLGPSARQLEPLRCCGYGAFTPGMEGIVDRARKRGLELRALYGSSEVHALFSLQSAPWQPGWPTPAGGGRPVCPQAFVRSRDRVTGRVLAHGEVGELQVKSPTAFIGYYGDLPATAAAFDEDDFFWTGDSGYTMPDGQFAYLERIGDMLRLSGFLVSPAEIESVILEDPALHGCQVVGALRGTVPVAVAFVILAATAEFDEDAARARCRQSLAGYKVPARIVPIDEFPRVESANASKVQKAALRARAQALLDAAQA